MSLKLWRTWRGKRYIMKGVKKMFGKSKLKKSVVKSRTTRNVAAGTLSTAGVVAWIVSLLRAQGWAPWPADWDVGIVAGIAGTLAPLISRLIAGLFDSPKEKRLKVPGNLSGPGVILLCFALGLGASGCATTTTQPDGTVIVSGIDSDAIAAIVAAVAGCDAQLARDIADAYIAVREAEGRIEREAARDRLDALASGLEGVIAMFRNGKLTIDG